MGSASRAASVAVNEAREPCWHRRARRRRAHARVLVRLGQAAELLGAHHSSQGMGAERAGGGNARCGAAGEPAVLRGPRKPEWGCPCGHSGNWACRVRCQRCGRAAPQRIAEAARAAAACRTTAAPGPGGGSSAEATRSAPRSHGAPGAVPTFAEVVERRWPARGSQARGAGGAGAAPPPAGGSAGSSDSRRQTELRYWRERRAAAVRAGPCAVLDVEECDRHIKSIEQGLLAARPWAARVQAATDARKAAADRAVSARRDLAAARRALEALEAEAVEADAALGRAEAALAAVQAEGAGRPGYAAGRPAAPSANDVDAALRVLGAAVAGCGAGVDTGAAEVWMEQLRGVVGTAHSAAAGGAADGAVAAAGGRDGSAQLGAPDAAGPAPATGGADSGPDVASTRRAGAAGGRPLVSGRRGTSPAMSVSSRDSAGTGRSRSRDDAEARRQAAVTAGEVRAGRQRTLDDVFSRGAA